MENKENKLSTNYTKIPNEFIDDFVNLHEKEIKVYLVLRSFINEKKSSENKVFPSIRLIMQKTGLCKKSVEDAINNLAQKGWFNKIEKSFKPDSKQREVNNYYLNNHKGEPATIKGNLPKQKSNKGSFQRGGVLINVGVTYFL